MAALYKTQCPHCAAQFRISDQHLKQAKGAVRCGSCLLIFQADQHLVEVPEGKTNPPIRTAPTTDTARNNWQRIDFSQNIEHQATAEKPSPSASELEFSDSFLALTSDNYSDSFQKEDFSDMQGAVASATTSNDDAWAEALLRELEESDDSHATLVAPGTPAKAAEAKHNHVPTTEEFEEIVHSATTETEAEAELDDWLNEGLFDELLLPEQVSEPTPPPANIFHRPGINWWQQFKWALLCLFLLAGLGAQFLYFNFDKLARTAEYRPFVAQFCELIGCQLPSMSNLNRIRSQHLVIRTHPEYKDALQVDALLYNLADHEQPYPNLGLEFSDKQGEIVASRLFKPSEYLPGNLKDATSMPSSTPVRISLTLVNPSNDAINHRLQFYSPDNSDTP